MTIRPAEPTNNGDKVQALHHPRVGILLRHVGRRMFVSMDYKKFTSEQMSNWEIMLPCQVPKEMIQFRRTRQAMIVECSKCKDEFPYSETDNGICRECLCITDPEEEKRQLRIEHHAGHRSSGTVERQTLGLLGF